MGANSKRPHSERRYLVEQPAGPPAPPRDGRPFWGAWPGGPPTEEGAALGRRIAVALQTVVQDLRLEVPIEGWDTYLVEIADQYLRLHRWVELPPPEFYRDQSRRLEKGAAQFLTQIRAVPDVAIEELDQYLLSGLGMYLKATATARNPAPNLEQLIERFLSICEEWRDFKGEGGRRGRPDLVYAAAALGDLWSELSGKPFPKNVDRVSAGGELVFTSGAADFIEKLLVVMDPRATRSQVATALKNIPVGSSGNEDVAEGANSGQDPS